MNSIEMTDEERTIIYNSLCDRRIQLLENLNLEQFKPLPQYVEHLKRQIEVIDNLIENKIY